LKGSKQEAAAGGSSRRQQQEAAAGGSQKYNMEQGYKDLKVYQLAYKLAMEIFESTNYFSFKTYE